MARIDITNKIGPLYKNDFKFEWPMYSFDTPAYILWDEIANLLHQRGYSQHQIMEWLQSKEARWALDGELGDAIRKAAQEFVDKWLGEEK